MSLHTRNPCKRTHHDLVPSRSWVTPSTRLLRLNITQLGNLNYEQQGHQTAEVQKLYLLWALNSRGFIHPPSPLTYSKRIKLFCSIRETSHQVKGQGHSVSSTVQSVKPCFSMYCSSTSITWQVCNSICSFCLSVIRVILKY